jgi:TRAP-type C4-dicarboxylate transport system permease large subunit
MGLFLMASVWWAAGRRNFPVDRWPGWQEAGRRLIAALPALALPVIILGGIFSAGCRR